MIDDRDQPDLDPHWEGLARYLAGESSPEEEERIRAQLAADAERAALVNALDAALVRPEEVPLSQREVEVALTSVMARRDLAVDRASQPSPDVIPMAPRPKAPLRQTPSRWRTAGLRAAAAVLLVAGLTVVWRGSRSTPPTTPAGRTASAAIVHQTRAGQIDTLKLADGSTVVLGPESRLALADDFGRKVRGIEFEGQAYFDVVHDDARPFIVRTSSATLRDIGTTFSVRSDSIGGTRVAVTSGAVDVVATRGPASSPTVLHAGDRAEVSGQRMRVERGGVTEAELAWTRGVLEFHDAPLPAVAQELRRWFGVELVVTDSTIASRRLTATFDHATADDVGRVLAAVLGGSVTRSGDTLRLGAARAR
ncbi:MAG: FecR family protein [Gemmatimonadaceae bacterium]